VTGGLGLGTEPGDTVSLLALLAEIGRGNLSLGRLSEGHVNALLLVAMTDTRMADVPHSDGPRHDQC
jgi:hypothetical protein